MSITALLVSTSQSCWSRSTFEPRGDLPREDAHALVVDCFLRNGYEDNLSIWLLIWLSHGSPSLQLPATNRLRAGKAI
jgi:hypothetical protein